MLVALQLAGCSPVYMHNAHVDCPPQAPRAVEHAILWALANRGWTAQKRQPGVIIGTLNIRTHQAVIEIDYNATGYTIRYVDSTNLDFGQRCFQSGCYPVINRHYNWWVEYLVSDINSRLGAFKVTSTS